MKPWEVLDKAADVIDERGWCQGARQIYTSVCAIGAMCIATDNWAHIYPLPEDAQNALEIFRRYIGVDCVGTKWNDALSRTKEDVTSTLRACALVEKAKAARLMPVVVGDPVTA